MCIIWNLANQIGFEIKIIGRGEVEADAVHFIGDVMEILAAVDVAENAVPDAVFFHDGKNVHGTAVVVVGRVVEHADDAARAAFLCQFYPSEEPSFFPAKDGCVVFRKFPGGFRDPAPRTGKGDGPHLYAVVMEKFKGAIGGALHFCHRVPPVVMVAADNDFPSRKGGDPFQIRERFCQVISPGKIAG